MELKIAEISKKTEDLLNRADNIVVEAMTSSDIELDETTISNIVRDVKRNVKIVFVGQYSAGKSSIIKAITGNDDIEVGEGITTQVSSVYQWNGLEIVDTPGIATGLRQDHDEIAKKAISQADLLVFVITNEGFDSTIVENFRELAYELPSKREESLKGYGKINEMMLVVNKMERMGNTKENQLILYKDICEALEEEATTMPKTCFISAESFIDSLSEEDLEIRQELENRSGFNEFIRVLNKFIQDKGLVGKLIMPIQQTETVLNDVVQKISGTIGEPNADAADTVLRTTINNLRRMQRKGQRDLINIFANYAMEIRSYGRNLADEIGNGVLPSDYEIERALQDISNKCQEDISATLDQIMEDTKIDIERITNSDLAIGFNNNVESGNLGEHYSTLKNISSAVSGLKGLATKLDKNMILQIGHLFKYKFKPWQATKLLKCMNKWLPIVGGIADLVTEIVDKQKAEEERNKMRLARQEMVSAFNNTADQFEQDGISFVLEKIVGGFQEIIDEYSEELSKLDGLKKNKSIYVDKLKSVIKECVELRHEIRRMS